MLTNLKSYSKLQSHYDSIKNTDISQLFTDGQRVNNFSLDFDNLYVDYSKNKVTSETISLLTDLATEANVAKVRDQMFAGAKINTSEDRSVLHTALRNIDNNPIVVNSKNIVDEINANFDKMRELSDNIRSGGIKSSDGTSIKNIVNIGIGGSDLGPAMATEALRFYSDRSLNYRFISNVDPSDFYEKTQGLIPSETLFIIVSKSFTTLETISNAETARAWLKDSGIIDASNQLIAVTSDQKAAESFGIKYDNIFNMWDFIGGRYSLMSAVGLCLMIAIGSDNFDEMRRGAHAMDQHFLDTGFQSNAPVILGLIGIWNHNFIHYPTEAILPYSEYLKDLPAYLQQANMESNGKSVTKDGQAVNYDTGPVIWGQAGTNGQHAFHQLLHQGTTAVPVDFIGFKQPLHDTNDQHKKLLANMIAQSKALAFGNTSQKDLPAHKIMPGDRPSNTILFDKLNPYSLGQLIALYEHKIFVQGQIWGINSFDQFGVELGKTIASQFLEGASIHDQKQDSSTEILLQQSNLR